MKISSICQYALLFLICGSVFADTYDDAIKCEEEVTSYSIGSPTCNHCSAAAPTNVTKLVWVYTNWDNSIDDTDYQLNQYDSENSSIGFGYHNPSNDCPYTVTPTVSGTYKEDRSVTGGFSVTPGFETAAKFSLPFGIAKGKVGYSLSMTAAIEGTKDDGVTLYTGWTGSPIEVSPRWAVYFILAKYKDTYNVYTDNGIKGPNYYWICPSCSTNTFVYPLVTTITSESVSCTGCKYSMIMAEGPYWDYY